VVALIALYYPLGCYYIACSSKMSQTIFFTSLGFPLPPFSNFSLANAMFTVVSIPNCLPSITSSACGLEHKAMYEVYAHWRLISYFCPSSILSTGSRSNAASSLIASSRISLNFQRVERSRIEIHSCDVCALSCPMILHFVLKTYQRESLLLTVNSRWIDDPE